MSAPGSSRGMHRFTASVCLIAAAVVGGVDVLVALLIGLALANALVALAPGEQAA